MLGGGTVFSFLLCLETINPEIQIVPGSRCLHNEPSRDKETKNILYEFVESTFTFDESDYEGVQLNFVSLCRPPMTFWRGLLLLIYASQAVGPVSSRSGSGSGSGPVLRDKDKD